MNQLHIVTAGISLLTNYASANNLAFVRLPRRSQDRTQNSEIRNHKSKMTPLLILTVGTGTAGKPACAGHADRHSDVAQGLANTIRQVPPRKFWLVPSASEKSTPAAKWPAETERT